MKNLTKNMTLILLCLTIGAMVVSCKKDVEKVEVTPATLTLKEGATAILSATVTPANAEFTLTWESSAPAIATVNASGTVTAIAEGKATITAEAGGKTATCVVTVEKDVPAIPVGVVLNENFDAGTLPTGWQTIDADGDSYTWDATFLAGQGLGHNSSSSFIASASYINSVGALTPDNWLITPQVQLNGNAELTFWLAGQDAGYAAEHYAVYISTTGTAPSDFTKLFEETFGDSKGHDGAKGTKAQTAWVQKTISLSGYTGNCYIAIRHFNCTDEFWLDLDDLKIENK